MSDALHMRIRHLEADLGQAQHDASRLRELLAEREAAHAPLKKDLREALGSLAREMDDKARLQKKIDGLHFVHNEAVKQLALIGAIDEHGNPGLPGWRCFHCDEMFTNREHANEHFGRDEGSTPACRLKGHEASLIPHVRMLEVELARAFSEDNHWSRALMQLEGDVADRVRNAEERGYNKGVTDTIRLPVDELEKLRGDPMPFGDSLRALLVRQFEWSERTFGAGYRMTALLKHIRKELQEIERAPSDPVEWIDVALLALDGAWRTIAVSGCGVTRAAEEVARFTVEKMDKNRQREWPKVIDPNEPSEHVRGGDGL
jgi:hypothetical protein